MLDPLSFAGALGVCLSLDRSCSYCVNRQWANLREIIPWFNMLSTAQEKIILSFYFNCDADNL